MANLSSPADERTATRPWPLPAKAIVGCEDQPAQERSILDALIRSRSMDHGSSVAMFVHGVPETPAVWDPLVASRHRTDMVALRRPGFGESAPEGFGATKEEYAGWLIDELEAVGEPVDAIGHDWVGGFVLRVACTRPDLLRSWVRDVAGILDPAYVWHDLAQIWQTRDDGEQCFVDTGALDADVMTQAYAWLGVTPAAARAFVEAADTEMARCILALYRSAIRPRLAEWLADAPAAKARPGLVVAPSADPYNGGPARAVRIGATAGRPGPGARWPGSPVNAPGPPTRGGDLGDLLDRGRPRRQSPTPA